MNLIFITIDGARVDRILKSKKYENIINQSTFFSKVIAYAPYTISAMHSVLSGTYGNRTGVNSYWSSPKFKKEKFKTLTKYLQNSGYVTFGDTINDLVLPKDGFDDLIIHDELKDDLTARHLEILEKFNKIRNEGKKFFLYLHYSNIHTGIMQEVLKKYDDFSEEYFSNREKNEKFYDELFQNAENYLETIFNQCKKLGITNDTLIVIISDHGISVGEKVGERAYGVFCYDYTLISTVIFHHKSLPIKHIQNQVRSVDILPTILDILSIPEDTKYEKMDGRSLLSMLDSNEESRISFSQSGNPLKTGKPPKIPNVWAIRTDDWKLIKNIHDGTEELYDLKNDPNEMNNIIDKFTEIRDELRDKLNQMFDSNSS